MKPKYVYFSAVLIILISLFFLSCGIEGAEFDWPRWRGPNGDGISQETEWNPTALDGGPKILWKTDIGVGHANIVIKENRLYAAGFTRDGMNVACLNADTGQEIWRSPFEGAVEIYSTPATDGKFVYAISLRGIIVCLKSKNGKLRWKRDLASECNLVKPTYGYGASVVVEGDLLVLTANTSGLVLNKKTGELVWDSQKPPKKKDWQGSSTGTDHSTPVVYDYAGKNHAVLSSYEGIHGVDIQTGQVLWLYEWDYYRIQVADPIVFDNRVFVAKYCELGSFLLDIEQGVVKVLWKNENLSSDVSSPVLVDGYVYGCDGGPETGFGTIRCLDVETGELMWEDDLRGGEWPRLRNASLISAAGKLIILEDDGTLHIAEASPSGYQEIGSCDVLEGERIKRWFWTHPVLCNGKIYCRNYPGDLICIDVRN